MKQIAGFLLILALMLPAWAEKKPSLLQVGPLKKEDIYDAGCMFWLRSDRKREHPVFVDIAAGAWLNLDGDDIRLTKKELPVTEEHHYATGAMRDEYFTEDVHMTLHYGKGREQEGGVTYKRATMVLSAHGQTRTVRLTGGCGC